MNCDMCGKETNLFKTDVEGTILSLCKECSRFGKVISSVQEVRKEKETKTRKELPSKAKDIREEEVVLTIVSDYGEMIKRKREQLGIDQEEFAKKINEKKALIHKIEINQFEPPIDLARKIEKFLHITLIEQQELNIDKLNKPKSEGFTIGDFVKLKR